MPRPRKHPLIGFIETVKGLLPPLPPPVSEVAKEGYWKDYRGWMP